MGFGKEAFEKEVPSWSSTFLWGGAAPMSDACGLPWEHRDAWKTVAALMLKASSRCVSLVCKLF